MISRIFLFSIFSILYSRIEPFINDATFKSSLKKDQTNEEVHTISLKRNDKNHIEESTHKILACFGDPFMTTIINMNVNSKLRNNHPLAKSRRTFRPAFMYSS